MERAVSRRVGYGVCSPHAHGWEKGERAGARAELGEEVGWEPPSSDLSKAFEGNAPFILWIWGWGACIGVKRPDHSSSPDWTTFGRSPAVDNGLRVKPGKIPAPPHKPLFLQLLN